MIPTESNLQDFESRQNMMAFVGKSSKTQGQNKNDTYFSTSLPYVSESSHSEVKIGQSVSYNSNKTVQGLSTDLSEMPRRKRPNSIASMVINGGLPLFQPVESVSIPKTTNIVRSFGPNHVVSTEAKTNLSGTQLRSVVQSNESPSCAVDSSSINLEQGGRVVRRTSAPTTIQEKYAARRRASMISTDMHQARRPSVTEPRELQKLIQSAPKYSAARELIPESLYKCMPKYALPSISQMVSLLPPQSQGQKSLIGRVEKLPISKPKPAIVSVNESAAMLPTELSQSSQASSNAISVESGSLNSFFENIKRAKESDQVPAARQPSLAFIRPPVSFSSSVPKLKSSESESELSSEGNISEMDVNDTEAMEKRRRAIIDDLKGLAKNMIIQKAQNLQRNPAKIIPSAVMEKTRLQLGDTIPKRKSSYPSEKTKRNRRANDDAVVYYNEPRSAPVEDRSQWDTLMAAAEIIDNLSRTSSPEPFSSSPANSVSFTIPRTRA